MTPLPQSLKDRLAGRPCFIPVPVVSTEPRVLIADIQTEVARHYGTTLLDLKSARRDRAVARPRQVAMYLAKRLTTQSLPEIGRRFGNRDHSTVIHAVKVIDHLRTRDIEIGAAVRKLTRKLQGRAA